MSYTEHPTKYPWGVPYKLEVGGKSLLPDRTKPSRMYLGSYEADTFLGLLWAIFRHRCWHLWHDHEWAD